MDVIVVHPLKTDKGLRYILRSVARAFGLSVRVVLVGPKALAEKYGLPSIDVKVNRRESQLEQINQVLIACANSPEVSEDFVLMPENCVAWNNHLTPPFATQRRLDDATHALLKKRQFPTNNFAANCPVKYNKQKVLQTLDIFKLDGTGYCIPSIYCNFWYAVAKEHLSVQAVDHVPSKEELERIFPDPCHLEQ